MNFHLLGNRFLTMNTKVTNTWKIGLLLTHSFHLTWLYWLSHGQLHSRCCHTHLVHIFFVCSDMTPHVVSSRRFRSSRERVSYIGVPLLPTCWKIYQRLVRKNNYEGPCSTRLFAHLVPTPWKLFVPLLIHYVTVWLKRSWTSPVGRWYWNVYLLWKFTSFFTVVCNVDSWRGISVAWKKILHKHVDIWQEPSDWRQNPCKLVQ